MSLITVRDPQITPYWWSARLALTVMLLALYGWTVFEPYGGDAFMHMMDDTQIHSVRDVLRTFYSSSNPAYQELHRLTMFHRPVFNELYVTATKRFFGVGSPWIRVMSLAMLIGTAWTVLSLFRNMSVNVLPATVATAWLVFSPSLFFGLYDFGIAFSPLLVLLSTLSLWSLKKYIDCSPGLAAKAWFILTVLFTFLAVFTKESAILWPLICLSMAAYFTESTQAYPYEKRSLINYRLKSLAVTTFTLRWFALTMAIITCLYLYTRYLKLGSLTAIAGGIEQPLSLSDALIKFCAYSLFALQIPSPAFPAYLTQSLEQMDKLEIAVRLLLFATALYALWAGWRKSRLTTLILSACIVLAFAPIIKVSRNSPYYGDLLAIPLAILLAIGFEAIKARISSTTNTLLSALVIVALFTTAALFAHRYVYVYGMWLAKSQGFNRSALSDFASAEGATEALQIVGTSGMLGREQSWSLNHNPGLFGATFIVNLGIAKEKFVLDSEQPLKNDKVLFIDFYPDPTLRKVSAFPLPGYGRLLTAYFPSGFVRKAIENSDDTFNIKGYKVIRLTCNSPFSRSFDIRFNGFPEFAFSRRIESEMNISSTPDKLMVEFVVPANATTLRLVGETGDICQTPQVSGYLAADPTELIYSTTINLSPRFENASDWGGQFTKNPNGSGVIVGPGAENPNVLSARFPVNPFEQLKIIARAKSIYKPTATGRLQINWIDRNNNFLSSSGKTIELTQAEAKFETYVIAPKDAASGILYVAPHGPQDIANYTEMTLLRAEKQ